LAAAAAPSFPPSAGPLQHARLLLAIHGRACVLPVRYGTVVPDTTAVEQFLGRHEEELLRQLARLRGTSEMGLRLTLAASQIDRFAHGPQGNAGEGALATNYLATRRAVYDRRDLWNDLAQATVERCASLLDGLFLEFRRRSPEPPGVLRLAFLVKRELAVQFARCVRSFSCPGLASPIVLMGPWPPYSFV
jgi:hypothetical protein